VVTISSHLEKSIATITFFLLFRNIMLLPTVVPSGASKASEQKSKSCSAVLCGHGPEVIACNDNIIMKVGFERNIHRVFLKSFNTLHVIRYMFCDFGVLNE